MKELSLPYGDDAQNTYSYSSSSTQLPKFLRSKIIFLVNHRASGITESQEAHTSQCRLIHKVMRAFENYSYLCS